MVGDALGTLVGLADGCDVVGLLVGAVVGLTLGASVGASVFAQHARYVPSSPAVGQQCRPISKPSPSATHNAWAEQSASAVGDAVGLLLGDALGVLGDVDGDLLGEMLGDVDGLTLGLVDGLVLGLALGLFDGAMVGHVSWSTYFPLLPS